MTNFKLNFLVKTLNLSVAHELEISHCFWKDKVDDGESKDIICTMMRINDIY